MNDNCEMPAPPDENIVSALQACGFVGPRPFCFDITSQLIVLCAEAGMGKTYQIRRIVWQLQGYQKVPVHSFVVNCVRKASVPTRVVGFARKLLSATEKDAVVAPGGIRGIAVFDGLPEDDERNVEREVRAVRKLVQGGFVVVIAVRPEAELIAERLPEALCLRSYDLALRLPSREAEDLWALTHGVPALARACCDDADCSDGALDGSTSYGPMLAYVVREHLRTNLSLEDRRLRLAMVLLGSGTRDDLSLICRHVDRDDLSWLAAHAPFFGIEDKRSMTFCCAGVASVEGLKLCAHALGGVMCEMGDVAPLVVEALMERGDVERASNVCGLCHLAEDRARLGCRYGVDFISVGSVELVREALSLHQEGIALDEPVRGARLAAYALASLSTDNAGACATCKEELPLEAGDPYEFHALRHARLMGRCRELRREAAPAPVASFEPDDDALSRSLVTHARAMGLMYEGKFSEAYAMLLDNPVRMACDDLAKALLEIDFSVCATLVGESQSTADQERAHKAVGLVSAASPKRLGRYQDCVALMLDIVMGSTADASGLEAGIRTAEKCGDAMTLAVMLMVSAAADLRASQLARAHVRASHARDLAERGSAPYVAECARLIDAVVCLRLGDAGQLRDMAAGSKDARSVPRDLAALLSHAKAMTELSRHRRRMPSLGALSLHVCDRNILWLLNVLLSSVGGLTAPFIEILPESWEWAVRLVTSHEAEPKIVSQATTEEPRVARPLPVISACDCDLGALPGDRPVHVRLLGGLEVTVGDVVIPAHTLDRRRARLLLVGLCLAPGHCIRRFEMVDLLWPGADFARGLQHLYECTSALRVALGCKRHKIKPIVSSRLEGTLSLDDAIVACDIDEFECEASATISGRGDASEVLAHAYAADALYRGDLCAVADYASVTAPRRRAALKRLYIDAMVFASELALDEGKSAQAVQLAHNAYLSDVSREDSAALLARSLTMAQRMTEAREVCEGFLAREEQVGHGPSLVVRKVLHGILPFHEGVEAYVPASA